MLINRAYGDESPIRILWKNNPKLDDVTGVLMRVYDDGNRTTLIETLTGERRGFDPGAFFPVINPDWVGTRHYEIGLLRGTEEEVLRGLSHWTQS